MEFKIGWFSYLNFYLNLNLTKSFLKNIFLIIVFSIRFKKTNKSDKKQTNLRTSSKSCFSVFSSERLLTLLRKIRLFCIMFELNMNLAGPRSLKFTCVAYFCLMQLFDFLRLLRFVYQGNFSFFKVFAE